MVFCCCVHGYHLLDFEQRFPKLAAVSDQIFVVDRQRITCAGGAASIDVAGYILQQCCGSERAHKILPHLVIDELRPADHPQLLFLDNFFSVHDQRVRSAVFLMQQNLANPISVTQIAERVGAPARQLQRGFQRFFTASPSTFFRKMRLGRARWLVLHSELTITQISIDCGFADTAHLTRSFKREYGELPTGLRKRVVLQNLCNQPINGPLSPPFKMAECGF
jgi:transcriptional regulator GlxA family with amidase domain